MLLAALVAIAALMMAAAPAFAKDNDRHDNNRNDFCDRFDINNCHRFFNDNNDRFVVFDGFDRFRPFDFNNEISQENEQEVESGDATQNIDVTGGGDNSNQCAGVQGVTNTDNATNNTSVLQANPNDGFFDGNRFNGRFRDGFHDGFHDGFFRDGFNNGGDVEVNDVGNFTISPSNSTSCNQQVNQAASAA